MLYRQRNVTDLARAGNIVFVQQATMTKTVRNEKTAKLVVGSSWSEAGPRPGDQQRPTWRGMPPSTWKYRKIGGGTFLTTPQTLVTVVTNAPGRSWLVRNVRGTLLTGGRSGRLHRRGFSFPSCFIKRHAYDIYKVFVWELPENPPV
jgi:hypothetical protein